MIASTPPFDNRWWLVRVFQPTSIFNEVLALDDKAMLEENKRAKFMAVCLRMIILKDSVRATSEGLDSAFSCFIVPPQINLELGALNLEP